MKALAINWKPIGQRHGPWFQHHSLHQYIFFQSLGWIVGRHESFEFDKLDTSAAEDFFCIDSKDLIVGIFQLAFDNLPCLFVEFCGDWIVYDLPKPDVRREVTRFKGMCKTALVQEEVADP